MLWRPRKPLPSSWQDSWEKRQEVTGSALISAVEWQEFFDYHAPKVESVERWVIFLVKSICEFQMLFVHFARRMRRNAAWAGGGGEEDWMGCERVAMEKLSWFLANKPSTVADSLTPAWATFLFQAVEGGLRTMARLGKEIDQTNRKGFKLVNVSPVVGAENVDNDPTAEEDRNG